MFTPWGASDYSETFAEGITFYGTPSHGGFRLSPERELELDGKLRDCGITAEQARMGYAPGWYEEDCSAHAVAYAWPELMPQDRDTTQQDDLDMLRYWLIKH